MIADRLPVPCLMAAALLALSAGAVHAQYALGDGTALDNNLRQGSDGVNRAGRSFSESLRLRNALVTGNVPAGLSFRGDVGYQASNDFRRITSELGSEDLGSEDLYTNLRDSYSSFLAARDVRGIYGLQQQFRYSVGGQSDDLSGSLIVDRPGASQSSNQLNPALAPQSYDVFGNLRGALRSTSEWQIQHAARPEVVQHVLRGGEELVIAASPLQGIATLPTDNPAFRRGIERDVTERRQGQVDSDPVGQAVANEVVSTHVAVLESIRLRVESDADLRARLIEARQPAEGDEDSTVEPETDPGMNSIEQLLQDRMVDELEVIRRRLIGQDVEGGESNTDEIMRRAAELLGGDRETIEELRPDLTGSGVYVHHMEEGSKALLAGRWFDAEERYTAALSVKPGDATAAVGRVHAQIGAGMFLSASINLRHLFKAYPEMIGVRFDASLLPAGQRLERVQNLLRAAVVKDTSAGRDAALLLAYLGRQYRNAEDMNLGLNRLREIRTTLELDPDALETLLRETWTE